MSFERGSDILTDIKTTINKNIGLTTGGGTSFAGDDVFIRTGTPGSAEDVKTTQAYWAMFLEKLKSQTEAGKKIIGLASPTLIYTTNYGQGRYPNNAGDANPLTITTFDTTTRGTAARIKLTNGQAYAVTVRNISIRGNPVFKLTGDEGIVSDSFIDDDSIRLTGERKLECGNDYIFNPDQITAIGQYFWDRNRSQYHIYTLTLEGSCNFLEVGKRYTLVIDHNPPSSTSGVAEEISSIVEIESISIERSAVDLGRTSIVCREIEETWQKRNQTVMRCRNGGNQKQDLARNNCVVIASQTYIGTADYYCDGTNDYIEIQAAIDYLSSNFNGGTVYLTEGDFNLGASYITPKSNIILCGTNKTVIRNSNTYAIYKAYGSSLIENFTISNLSLYDSSGGGIYFILIDAIDNLILENVNISAQVISFCAFYSGENFFIKTCKFFDTAWLIGSAGLSGVVANSSIINSLFSSSAIHFASNGLIYTSAEVAGCNFNGAFIGVSGTYTFIATKNIDCVSIVGNNFTGGGTGVPDLVRLLNCCIGCYASTNITVGENIFKTVGEAISIYDCDRVCVTGNVLRSGTQNAIAFHYSTFCTASNNTVNGFTVGSGIVVYTGCANTTISANLTTNNVNGIIIGGPATVPDRTVVTGNRSTGNSGANYVNTGTNTTATGNDFV